ncbi:MAG: hypothetical protein ACTSPI_13330 [Candidatus Heimdallarchaeaceae archaeon]
MPQPQFEELKNGISKLIGELSKLKEESPEASDSIDALVTSLQNLTRGFRAGSSLGNIHTLFDALREREEIRLSKTELNKLELQLNSVLNLGTKTGRVRVGKDPDALRWARYSEITEEQLRQWQTRRLAALGYTKGYFGRLEEIGNLPLSERDKEATLAALNYSSRTGISSQRERIIAH